MKLEAFEAHGSCGYFAPNNIKIGSAVKKLSQKNLGVSNEFGDTVTLLGILNRSGISVIGAEWDIMTRTSQGCIGINFVTLRKASWFLNRITISVWFRMHPWNGWIVNGPAKVFAQTNGCIYSFPVSGIFLKIILYFAMKIFKNRRRRRQKSHLGTLNYPLPFSREAKTRRTNSRYSVEHSQVGQISCGFIEMVSICYGHNKMHC